ncbi:AzlD domain-containing protein [Bacillus sp. HMF5848]|uniref:AzlD domain-containing protein n=1 Tax=Bacillus sp. HMF5848 TaxID=2495421 RepID=UPI000F790D39|nr:AzlD domain-containing protein [Bacillus sp. HMF5848]RSK26346.1 AzlD domain-containing protein [Bacillus sp. HMF5848]
MNSNIVLIIIGMAVVTYLPRVLPLIALSGKDMPEFWQNVLRNVPYATLGALIFPGILLIQEGDIWFGIIGAVAAFAVAFLGANVIIVVLSSIVVLSIYSYFIL